MLESLVSEIRLAARALRRYTAFTIAAVLTLAIGIGATTAVFSVVYGILYRPLPFPNAERLVQIVQVPEPMPASPAPLRLGLTSDQFVDLQEGSKTLEAVGSYTPAPRTLTGIDVPMRLSGAGVSPALFAGLGVSPAIGRMFVAEDGDRPILTDPVVILSYRTWVRYFGADPNIVNRRIALGDTRPTVIGVMPEGFGFPSLAGSSMAKNSAGELEDAPEFWLAMAPYQRLAPASGYTAFQAFAILRPNVTPAQAVAEIRSLLSPLPGGRRASVELVTARREMAAEVSGVLTIFQLGVTLILLIACVNVTNLLLTRAAHRRHESAIRTALGASRGRVIRENVTESTLLSLAGGVLGCLFAYALTGAVRALPPHLLPRLHEIRVDGVVLLFALGLSVGSGLLVGLFSGLRAARAQAISGLSSHALRGSSTHRRLRPSGLLVVVEIAATMILLTGAGLLINSFTRLMQVDPGFAPDGAVTFRLALPASRYPTPQTQHEFGRGLLAALRGLPGVESAAATSYALGGGPIGFDDLVIDGQSRSVGIGYRFVTPDYFRTLRTPMRSGREFHDGDRGAGSNAAVVNEAFARQYLGGTSVVGRAISYADWGSFEIVGVVADSPPQLGQDPRPTLYLPVDGDAPFGNPSVILRTAIDLAALLPAIRELVSRGDPQLAVFNAMTLEEMIAHTAAPSRLYSLVSVWCALIALTLAAVGLYGVLGYSVGTRTQEFGIRMALGATSRHVVASVMRRGIALSAAGIAAGLAGSLYLTRFLDTLLFSLTPRDVTTYAVAAAMFVGVTMIASYIPSRRATRVNPVVALRAE